MSIGSNKARTPQRGIEAPPASRIELVFHSHARFVEALAMRILGNRSDVDDVVQDVFIAAAEGGIDQVPDVALCSWLGTVTVRTAQRRLRRRRLQRLVHFRIEREYDGPPDATVEALGRITMKQLYEVLDELPVRVRVAWTLRFVQGESLESVAVLCACSLATAKRRIAAAQTHIKEAFSS